jgi:hypothetical protein
MPAPTPSIRQTVLTNQLIHAALGMGVLMFLGVVIAARSSAGSPHPAPFPPLIFAVFAVSSIAAGLVLYRFMLPSTIPPQANDRQADQDACFGEFLRRYQKPMLVRAALAEGAALFGCVMLFMEKGTTAASPWYFCGPIAFLALQAMTFPTEMKLRELYESLRRSRVSR